MNKLLKYGTTTLITFITLLCILSPDFLIIQSMTEYTVHIMFGFLTLGILSLIFDNKHLLLVSLVASGSLALFLKNASNSDLRFPEIDKETSIKIAHFNLSNLDHDLADVKDFIATSEPDILSFQEYTPEWISKLNNTLSSDYTYAKTSVRIDPFGMAIYSKYPLKNIQIKTYENIPNLVFNIQVNDKKLGIISSYMLPPALDQETRTNMGHLKFVGNLIKETSIPTILVGDFNVVYWSKEISTFRNQYSMNNSRKTSSPYGLTIPYDHMLHTKEIQCSSFKEIVNSQGVHIGISGVFQPTSEVQIRNYGVVY